MAPRAFKVPDTVASRLSSLKPEPDHPGLGWLIGPAEVETASSESAYPILSSILSSNAIGKEPTVESISTDLKEAFILIPAGVKVCGAFLFEGSRFKESVVTALGRSGCIPADNPFLIATISSGVEVPSSRDQTKEVNDLRWTIAKAGASGFEEQGAVVEVVTGEAGSPAWQHPVVEAFWKEHSVIYCDLPVKLPLYLSPYQCEWSERASSAPATWLGSS